MPQECYIYTLHASNDPEKRPRYVGFTRFLKNRKKAHLSGKEPARKGDWAREVIRSGGHVVLKVVHTFCSDDAHERGIVEAQWINYVRKQFPDLLNDKGGGGGLADCSPERRKKMSIIQRKRYSNPAEVEKNRKCILAYYATPGAKEKSREAAIRRYSRPSEIEKVSCIQKKRFTNPLELEKSRRITFLRHARKDLLSPPSEKKRKQRMACLRWKARKDAEKKGLPFNEQQWLVKYKAQVAAIEAEVLEAYL